MLQCFLPQPQDSSRTFRVCEKTHNLRTVIARARMTATAPFGTKVEASASASISLVRFSDLTFTTTTTLEGGDGVTGSSPGDRIKYDLSITNDGTVTITDLDVTDSLLSVADDRQEGVIVDMYRTRLLAGGARACFYSNLSGVWSMPDC